MKNVEILAPALVAPLLYAPLPTIFQFAPAQKDLQEIRLVTVHQNHHHFLNQSKLTLVTHHHVDQTLNVITESALVCLNTKVIRIESVDQNVFCLMTVPEIRLALGISAVILVLVLVDRMLNVLW